jgi:hypothetical protein
MVSETQTLRGLEKVASLNASWHQLLRFIAPPLACIYQKFYSFSCTSRHVHPYLIFRVITLLLNLKYHAQKKFKSKFTTT